MEINIVLNVIGIILPVIVLILSLKIYYFNPFNKGWLGLPAALGLTIIRRILVLASSVGWLSSEWSSKITIIDTYLFVISVTLYTIGLWAMYKNFKSFDVIEKQTKERIKAFQKRK